MKRSEIIQRMHYALKNSKARYRLGTGGMDPFSTLPENKSGFCDCTGFISWGIGQSRKTTNSFLKSVNGGWIETTAIVKDAKSPNGMFTKQEKAVVGDMIVYGDAGKAQGHVGFISEVKDGKATKVIHCSSAASRNTGKALTETGAAYFYGKGAIHVKFDAVVEDIKNVVGTKLPADHDCVGLK